MTNREYLNNLKETFYERCSNFLENTSIYSVLSSTS